MGGFIFTGPSDDGVPWQPGKDPVADYREIEPTLTNYRFCRPVTLMEFRNFISIQTIKQDSKKYCFVRLLNSNRPIESFINIHDFFHSDVKSVGKRQ